MGAGWNGPGLREDGSVMSERSLGVGRGRQVLEVRKTLAESSDRESSLRPSGRKRCRTWREVTVKDDGDQGAEEDNLSLPCRTVGGYQLGHCQRQHVSMMPCRSL